MMPIAMLQLNPVVGDLAGNAAQIVAAATAAHTQGAAWAVTPELALWGYPPRDLLLRSQLVDVAQQQLAELATQLPLPVLVGSVTPSQGQLYNSAVWLADGRIQQRIHKQRLPTYDVFDERRYFVPGEASQNPVITWQGQRIGVTICEDMWPGAYSRDPLANLLSHHQRQAIDVVVNLSASPYSAGKPYERQQLLSSLAQRYPWPLVYVNQVGGNDQIIFDGQSCAVRAAGRDRVICLAQAPRFCPSVTLVDLKAPGQPFADDDSDAANSDAIYDALVLGLRDYVRKCGFERVVLGISGGIDSAIVAAIAVEALGAAAVLGVLLPSPYSSAGSITDAQDLASRLGITTTTLPIETLLNTSLETLSDFKPSGITVENLQSRLRGLLLMAIANQERRLLLSTGNKSELAVGYCTLYGDMSGAIAPLGDLYKTQVYALAASINRRQAVIPETILIKPPSAELRPDQRDSDSLPDYAVLDAILQGLVEQRSTASELIAQGIAPAALIERVASLIQRAEFKRQQAPPALRVSASAFGSGWRMAIARK